MGSTLVNLGIKEKLPFIKDTKEVIENKIKKEIEITMRTNNNLFLVFLQGLLYVSVMSHTIQEYHIELHPLYR